MNLDLEREFRPTLLRLKDQLSQRGGNDPKPLPREWMMEQVEAALERMEEKTYGTCRDCFLVIPLAELLMRPYAEICPDCRIRKRAGLTARNSASRISPREPNLGKGRTALRPLVLTPLIVALLGIGMGLASAALR